MALVITTSPNIAIFDFSATYNLNTQRITLANLSTYIGGGAAATQGIDFTLTSPSGIIYYQNTTYGVNSDIKPAAPNTPFSPTDTLPSFQGAIEYGNWVAQGNIKDQDGTIYTYSQSLNICQPPTCANVTNTSNSCAVISFTANCSANKVIYEDKTIYVYKGQSYSQITYDVSMTYPPIAAKSPILHANIASFTNSPIFDGTYNFVLNNTATYTFGTQSVVIVYKLNQDYPISCAINLCGILCAYGDFIDEYKKVANDTNSTQFRTMQNNMILLNSYVNEAIIKSNCGEDLSEVVAKIEFITGSKCNCQCGSNNPQPVTTEQDIVITAGCGDISVVPVTVGNTTTFTISDKSYAITSLTDGLDIEVNTSGCVNNYTIQICVDQLPLCSSVLVVPNINDDYQKTATNVPAGTLLITVLEEIADTESNVIDRVIETQTDLSNTDVNVDKLLTVPIWGNLTGLNGWSRNVNPQQSVDLWSFVHLRGSFIKTNPTNNEVFTKVLFPPSQISIFNAVYEVNGAQQMGIITIDTAGNIAIDIAVSNNSFQVILDGINYSTS